jgi:hypothetical protein
MRTPPLLRKSPWMLVLGPKMVSISTGARVVIPGCGWDRFSLPPNNIFVSLIA